MVPNTHPLARHARIDLAEAAREEWIAPLPDSPCHPHVVSACGAAGFTPDVAHHALDWNVTAHLVAMAWASPSSPDSPTSPPTCRSPASAASATRTANSSPTPAPAAANALRVYRNAEVWLNGVHLGFHPYGYTSFAYDVTSHPDPTGTNVLAVGVDNSGQNSRWYSGSGIYRHTWLTVTGPVRIPLWGVHVETPVVSTRRSVAQVGFPVFAGIAATLIRYRRLAD